jgi:diguanylate cyclase (GGDEF)-like protein
VTESKLVPEKYGIAVAAALLALISFCFILFLSNRCRQLESSLRELSLRDQLTQLYNRHGFLFLAEQGLRLARRDGKSFFLLFIDMDNLKKCNDTFGHEAGSVLLQEMGALLSTNFREADILGRLGGDEFIIAGKGTLDQISPALARLNAANNPAKCVPGQPFPLSFSLGQVTADSDSTETIEELIHRADALMYAAKRHKKNRAHETAAHAEAYSSEARVHAT